MISSKFVKPTIRAKCKCKGTEKVVEPVSCGEDDKVAVALLPDDWVPRYSGPILANYLMKREQDHKKRIEEIAKCALELNADMNAKVKNLSENLLSEIKQNEQKMDCVIQTCVACKAALTKEARNNAFIEIKRLRKHRVDYMATYKREARALERQRADGLRILLRDDFQRLIAIGHKTPKDLLHDFDQQIYEINQQLLGNSRAYTELEAQLRVQADESVLRAQTCLNQLCLSVGLSIRGRSAITRTESDTEIKPRSGSADRYGSNVSNTSLGGILSDVEEFEAVVTCLVRAYRTAVLKVFDGFSSKLAELEKDLYTQQGFMRNEMPENELIDFQNILDRAHHRLSANINKTSQSQGLMEKTIADLPFMKKSLSSLGDCLHDTYTILRDAGHLWDAHILRSALAQKLTIAAVEDLLTSNDTLELANDVPFNVALEHMRCSSDARLLQNEFNAIMGMLDKTAEMYMQHSQTELGRLEEFMKLPMSMANTLLAEFNMFLEKHPRPAFTSFSHEANVSDSPSGHNHIHLPLPRAILQTELKEIALKNWRNGFLETFESNFSVVAEELKHQAQLWVEKRGAVLQMRFTLKMVSHSIRVERVKAARDERLAELDFHEVRLSSHLKAVNDLVDRLPQEAAAFAAIDAPFLYPLSKWKARLESEMKVMITQDPVDHESIKLKTRSYILRLTKYRELFEQSLDTAILDFKNQMEYRVQEARVSNVRFTSHIKLFGEGGRYGTTEALRACSALVRGSESLEASITRALNALTRRREQLLDFADTELMPLRHLLGMDTEHKRGDSAKKKPTKKK